MENAVFYLFVAIWAYAGYKKGAAGAGYIFTSVGMASYFSVWLLPFSMKVLEYIPAEYASYVFPLILAVSFILLFSIVRGGIDKIFDKYPAADSDIVLSEMPLVSNVVGGVFGVCSGYAATSFFMFLITFAPIEVPYVTNDGFAAFADGKFFAFSRTVNRYSEESWNTRQQAYVKSLSEQFRKYSAEAIAKQKAEEEKAATSAAPETPQGSSDIPAPVVPGTHVPVVQGAPAASVSQDEANAAQRFARKAVQSAAANQEQAMKAVQNAYPAVQQYAAQGGHVVNGAVQTQGSPAVYPQIPAPVSSAPAVTEYTGGVSYAPALPGEAAPSGTDKDYTEAEGVTFSLVLPVLNEDGSNSGFTKVIKLGIRLEKDGKLPKVIDIDAPHPVLHHRDRVIYRKIRVDMSRVSCAYVRNLKANLDTKYVVVENK